MEKTFIGEVILSETNEFSTKEGEVITLWKIGIALSEEKSMIFNVSKMSEPELFQRVQDALIGMNVKITAEPRPTQFGGIKWKLKEIEQA